MVTISSSDMLVLHGVTSQKTAILTCEVTMMFTSYDHRGRPTVSRMITSTLYVGE
jgi:hypothetical protein